jgi:hypothetical protein
MTRIVSSCLALALGFLVTGSARADNACGNGDKPPQILAAAIVAPTTPSELGVASLRAELVTDPCTYVAVVRLGDNVVPWTVRDQLDDPSKVVHHLELAVPEPQDKWAGGVVTILIRRSGGISRTTAEMYVEQIPVREWK